MKHLSIQIRTAALLMLCGQGYAESAVQHKHPAGNPPTPPKEAFEACANLIAKDPCTITLPDSNVLDGSCELTSNAAQVEGSGLPPDAHATPHRIMMPMSQMMPSKRWSKKQTGADAAWLLSR